MAGISTRRAFMLTAILWIAAYSFAPFELADSEDDVSDRLARSVEFAPQAIGPVEDLVGHLAAFSLIGGGVACSVRDRRRGRVLVAALLVSAAVSFGIEAIQLGLLKRHVHVMDIVANLAGAAVGAEVGRRGGPLLVRLRVRFRRGERRFHAAALCVLTLAWLTLLIVSAMAGLSLDRWDLTYPLLVGDEVGGRRSWLGGLRYVAFYARALNAEEAQARFVHRFDVPSASSDASGTASAIYDFTGAEGTTIPPTGPLRLPPLFIADPAACTWLAGGGLSLDAPTVLSTREPPVDLIEAIQASDEFSVEVWCRPGNLTQAGPARIVSNSAGTDRRNFTLGQEGTGLAFRVRHDIAGKNGSAPGLRIPRVLTREDWIHLVATYRRGVSRLYCDGAPAPRVLDCHTPAALLGLGDSAAARFAGALICVFPLTCSGRAASKAARPIMAAVFPSVPIIAGLAGGWLIRFAFTGHEPDWGTLGWCLVAYALSCPVVSVLYPRGLAAA